MEIICFEEMPELKNPLLIVGISGWADAGEISSGSISYLGDLLSAQRFASIPTERFYNFTKQRPIAVLEDGMIHSITFPANTFYYSYGSATSPDCILLDAIEPHLDWDDYINAILDFAKRFSTSTIVTIGGVIDEIPHTLDPQVTALASEKDVQDRLMKEGVHPIDYVGPSSIHGPLLEKAHAQGLQFISLWGHCPYYIQEDNPSVCYKVLLLLKELTGISLDLQELEKKSRDFKKRLDLELQKNAELRHLIQTMEKTFHERARTEEKAASKGEKVVEIKAFIEENTAPPEEDGRK
jgi:proteasome assembly chaperone (PAC2) family protein